MVDQIGKLICDVYLNSVTFIAAAAIESRRRRAASFIYTRTNIEDNISKGGAKVTELKSYDDDCTG